MASYLYFVLKAGPRYMKNREPFSLRYFMLLFNGLQILANIWLCYYVSKLKMIKKSNTIFNKSDVQNV